MERLTENKIVLITRTTRLDELLFRYNTRDQAQFYIQQMGGDFADYLAEDSTYKQAVAEVEQQLKRLGRVQQLERHFVPNFIFGPHDVIVVVGQDGLVANVLKYLDQQAVVAINPDPKRWDGVLLPFETRDARQIVSELFAGKRSVQEITFAQVKLNDGQCLYGVNDLFIGPKSHTSARYLLSINGKQEQQSSSGIIVSTGLGSTGWLSSVLAGAQGVLAALTGRAPSSNTSFAWDAHYLRYSVREPYPSRTSGVELVYGKVEHGSTLQITSMMASNGVIFSDGIESDFLEFNAGKIASVGVADKRGRLVV